MDAPAEHQTTTDTLISSPHCLRVGDRFASYDALVERLQNHSAVDFVNYWRRDTRTLKGALMKTSRPIAACLRYYSVRYACVHGGQRFDRRGTGQRNKQTMRRDCPAHITVRASKCGRQLEVIAACNQHNHPVGQHEALQLPQNRRLSRAARVEVVEMLRSRVDLRTIVEHVRGTTGIPITAKDLTNLRRRCELNTELVEVLNATTIEADGDRHSAEATEAEDIPSHVFSESLDENGYYQVIDDADNLIEYDAQSASGSPQSNHEADNVNDADNTLDYHDDGDNETIEYLTLAADDESMQPDDEKPDDPEPIAEHNSQTTESAIPPKHRRQLRPQPSNQRLRLQRQIAILLAQKRQLTAETQTLRRTKKRLLAETAALSVRIRQQNFAE